MKKIELLSPAGDIERAKYAIGNGADAIYIGGKEFSARSSASNFDFDDMKEIIQYATLRGVKVFLAVNTLIKNSEFYILAEYLEKIFLCGIRTLIIQDIGVAKFINDKYDKFILHASTQLTAHSLEDVLKLQEVGFKRVVLSRELSLEEISYIINNTTMEIEVFCHGANCVCYSGQCLMSSLIGGRSGNRGKCAQPCRLSYDLLDENYNKIEKGYLLSPKDTFSIENIEKLIEIGVTSLKIEGRMKNSTYVSTVTAAYRNKIDSVYCNTTFDESHINNITQIFNRGGSLSTMYMDNYSSKNMMSTVTPKSTGIYVGVVKQYRNRRASIELVEPLNCADVIEIWTKEGFENAGTNISRDFLAGEYAEIEVKGEITIGDKVYKTFDKNLENKYKNFLDNKKVNIYCDILIRHNQPIELKIYLDDIIIKKIGMIPEVAKAQGTPKEMVMEKIGQTGNTTFSLEYINVEVDEGLFISIKELKNLRKEALVDFEKLFILKDKDECPKIVLPEFPLVNCLEKQITVEVNNLEQLFALKNLKLHRVIVNLEQININEIISLTEDFCFSIYCKLPRIYSNIDDEFFDGLIKKIHNSNIKGFVVCTYGELFKVKKISDKDICLDLSFNVFNSMSMRYLQYEDNVKSVCVSPELNVKELKNMSCEVGELIVYGRLPQMITKQCPVGLYVANKGETRFCSMKNHNSFFYFRDRKGEDYPIFCNCNFCYASILDKNKINLLSNNQLLASVFDLKYKFFKLIFTNEGVDEVKKITDLYLKALDGEKIEHKDQERYYGHYNKGVL
ncbi:MAG: DUF3656 domain-containing protein [Lachnospirales bacterium]